MDNKYAIQKFFALYARCKKDITQVLYQRDRVVSQLWRLYGYLAAPRDKDHNLPLFAGQGLRSPVVSH